MPAITNYLDFDLVIERDGDRYRSRVIDSPGGQASSEFQMPVSGLELENFLLRVGMSLSEIRRNVRRIDSSDMAEIKAFGGRLFRAVFDEELRPTLVRSLDEARRRGAGLRIRLRISGSPELADCPWEYLYDTSANRFLNLSVETPLIRYLELSEPGRPLPVQAPLRVLVMISGPRDIRELDVESEWTRIKSAVADLESRGLVVLERLEAANLAALQRALRRGEYHILHYVGHGGYDEQSQDGVLLLEGMDGRSRPVSGQDLGTLLHDHRSLRLVVLNSCEGARTSPTDPFAGAAQSLVQQGIPAVIAMQFEITDDAAITLSQEFYTALADGYPVDTALGEARKAIFAGGNEVEWATPVLYMRSPNGRLFRMARQPSPPPRVETPPPTIASTPSETVEIAEMVAAVEPEVQLEATREKLVPDPLPPTRAAAPPALTESEPPVQREPASLEPTDPTTITARHAALTLVLIGAALLLIGTVWQINWDPDLIWFAPEKLLAVFGATAFATLVIRGKQPAWIIGTLIGLCVYLVVINVPFVVHKEDGLLPFYAAIVVGSALIAAGGMLLVRGLPTTAPHSRGWLPTVGALVIGVGSFLPVTSDSGPVSLATMGDWLVGNPSAVLAPLLLLTGWIFVLSLYPSKRGPLQSGQLLGLGAQFLIGTILLGGFGSVVEGWGTSYGLWIIVVGAALVFAGAWRSIRRSEIE